MSGEDVAVFFYGLPPLTCVAALEEAPSPWHKGASRSPGSIGRNTSWPRRGRKPEPHRSTLSGCSGTCATSCDQMPLVSWSACLPLSGISIKKQDDIAVLANMFTSLRPAGVCLIDVMGKERLARSFQSTTSDRLPDGTTLVQRHEIFDDWTRVRNEWLLIRKDRVKRFTFHHTVYSGQELRDRMEQVGFVGVTLYGNLNGDEYGPNAQRLIAVGRKQDA